MGHTHLKTAIEVIRNKHDSQSLQSHEAILYLHIFKEKGNGESNLKEMYITKSNESIIKKIILLSLRFQAPSVCITDVSVERLGGCINCRSAI